MNNNQVCKLLGIKYPIIQGAMAWIADGHLAGHVSKAGGLGIIAGGGMDGALLRTQIQKAKAITSNPFGVNLMLMMPNVSDQIDVCIEEKVAVVTTGAGNPGPYMEKLKAAGIKVIPVVASVALAKRMEKIGADAIIAEGSEAGGHIGEITTMCLLPQVAEAVSIPVIGAGGIATGRQFLAAISMGAEAVQCGTIFLTAHECLIHENYKEAVIKAKDRSSVVTGTFSGHPVRVLENKLSKAMHELEKTGAPQEELEKLGAGSLRKAVQNGDLVEGSIMAGQVAAMVNKRAHVTDILVELMNELETAKKDLDAKLNSWK